MPSFGGDVVYVVVPIRIFAGEYVETIVLVPLVNYDRLHVLLYDKMIVRKISHPIFVII